MALFRENEKLKKGLLFASLILFVNGLNEEILDIVIQEIQPNQILCIAETPPLELITFAQKTKLQHVSNLEQSYGLLNQPLDFDGIVLVSQSDPIIVSSILASSVQHNFVYNSWIVTGINSSQLATVWSRLFQGEKKFKGFSDHLKMFIFFHGDFVLQIVGNGYKKPIVKDCGQLKVQCNLAKAISNADNKNDYHGQELVVSYEDVPAHSIQNENGTMDGTLVNVVRHLEKALNLTVKFQRFQDRFAWGSKLDDGTWSGNLGDIVNGIIHTSVAGYIPSMERAEVVDFTMTVVDEIGGYVIKRPEVHGVSLLIYLGQFMPIAWFFITVAFAVCFCSLIIMILCYKKQLSISSVGSCLETVFFAMINKPPKTLLLHSNSQRAIVFTLFLMALLLMSYYKSQLKATLAIQSLTLPINSLDDILASELDLLLWRATFLESAFKLAPKGSLMRQIYDEKLHGKKRVHDVGGKDASLQLVEEGKAIYTAGIDSIITRPEYPCKIIDVKSLRSKRGLTLPFVKESPFYHSAQKALGKFKQSGLLDKLQYEFLHNRKLAEEKTCRDQTVSLSFSKTFLPFACLLLGFAFSCLVVSCEHFCMRHKTKDLKWQLVRRYQLQKYIYDQTQFLSLNKLETMAKFCKRNS